MSGWTQIFVKYDVEYNDAFLGKKQVKGVLANDYKGFLPSALISHTYSGLCNLVRNFDDIKYVQNDYNSYEEFRRMFDVDVFSCNMTLGFDSLKSAIESIGKEKDPFYWLVGPNDSSIGSTFIDISGSYPDNLIIKYCFDFAYLDHDKIPAEGEDNYVQEIHDVRSYWNRVKHRYFSNSPVIDDEEMEKIVAENPEYFEFMEERIKRFEDLAEIYEMELMTREEVDALYDIDYDLFLPEETIDMLKG